MEYMIPIRKVDAERRLLYGRAIEEIPDRSDEILDYESSKPLIQAWSDDVARATGGQSLGNIRVMHGKQVAGKITDMKWQDSQKALDIVVKVVDDNEWRKVLEGCYTGFSIGGSYDKKWQDGHYTRYTANPTEISLLDRPCVPTAMFFEVVKADGLKEQRQFQNVEGFKPAMFNNLFKAEGKPDGRKGRDADGDGKTNEEDYGGSDSRYYSQLVGGAAGGALGATAGMEAADRFMEKPARNIGRKVEASTRLAGRQAGLTQAMASNPTTALAGGNKSAVRAQGKLYGNLASMGVKGAVGVGGMLIGGALGDAAGDWMGRKANDKITGEKGTDHVRQGSLIGTVGGAILGTAGELTAQFARKTRMSTGARLGRGFIGGTIGAIVGEMAGNYMDRTSGASRMVFGAAEDRFDRKMIGADTKVGKAALFGDLYKGTSLTSLAKYGTPGRDGDGDGQVDERGNPQNEGLQSRSNVLGDTTTDEWTAERVVEGLGRNFGMVVGEMAGHAIGIPGLRLGGGAVGRFIGSAGGGIGGSAVGSQVGGEAGEVIDEKFGEKNPRPVERPVGTGEAIGRIGGALVGGWGAGIGAGLVAAPTGPGAIAAAIGAKTAGGFAGEEVGGMIGRLYDDYAKLEAPATFDQPLNAGGAIIWQRVR